MASTRVEQPPSSTDGHQSTRLYAVDAEQQRRAELSREQRYEPRGIVYQHVGQSASASQHVRTRLGSARQPALGESTIDEQVVLARLCLSRSITSGSRSQPHGQQPKLLGERVARLGRQRSRRDTADDHHGAIALRLFEKVNASSWHSAPVNTGPLMFLRIDLIGSGLPKLHAASHALTLCCNPSVNTATVRLSCMSLPCNVHAFAFCSPQTFLFCADTRSVQGQSFLLFFFPSLSTTTRFQAFASPQFPFYRSHLKLVSVSAAVTRTHTVCIAGHKSHVCFFWHSSLRF